MAVCCAVTYVKGITMQLESVRCGDPHCSRCPHGPYWYGYYRRNGRSCKQYFGVVVKAAAMRQWTRSLGMSIPVPKVFIVLLGTTRAAAVRKSG